MQKVEEVSKKTPPELLEYYEVPIPDMYDYWEDFLEIHKKRTRGEGGDNPLTFVEIEAWARLVGYTPTQLWLDTIEMLDQVWLRCQSKK